MLGYDWLWLLFNFWDGWTCLAMIYYGNNVVSLTKIHNNVENVMKINMSIAQIIN